MAMEAGILSTIGKTPLVVLNKLFPAASSIFHGKLEMLNPGGSTKDRTALLMLSKAVENGELDQYSTVIELSSGNMAIALAQVCRYLDLKLIMVTDPKINRHTLDLIQAYGAQVERVVAEYRKKYLSEIRFDADGFLEPVKETESHKGISHHQYITSSYDFYLQEARKGELRSPLAAVTAVWRKTASLFCEVYSFGGLTPESQRYFDRSVRGKLSRVAYGPPVKSAEKLYALMESGILNFDAARNPDLILDEKTGLFILASRSEGTRHPVHYLVDARMPTMSLADDPGHLFRNLLDRGLITIYENRFGREAYQPGAVNITRQGFVIDRNGRINRGIAVTGTPTEGITFDNDTLSRYRNNFVDSWAEHVSMEYAKSTSEYYADCSRIQLLSAAYAHYRFMDGKGFCESSFSRRSVSRAWIACKYPSCRSV